MSAQSHLRLNVYLKGLRPLDSLGYVVVALIGAGSFSLIRGLPAAELLVKTFLIAEVLMGSIFLLNNRFDYALDGVAGEKKASKNPISTGLIGLREAEVLSLVLVLLGLLAVLLWVRSSSGALLYLIAWSVGLLYSAPPFRFKSRAGFDVASHGIVVVALFLMGYSFLNALSWTALIFGFPFLMLSTIYELRNHLMDWASDSTRGVRTSITAFGLRTGRRLLWLSIILFWLSVLSVGYLLGEGMTVLVSATILSYSVFLIIVPSRLDFVFDVHLWMMGGVYSAYKLLLLAGLL